MKNTKILAVLGIILAMGMTACGQQSGQVGSDSVVPSDHQHDWGEGVVTTEPTCEEKGVRTYTCSCGETKTESIKALGHDWGEWSVKTAATCTQDGAEERACKRQGCGKTEERVVKAAHDWDAEQTIAAGTDPADQVGYTFATCKKGDAVKVDIKAVDAKFYKGKIKESTQNPTPEGYFKLDATGSKAYWKFTVAGAKLYKGMLYQRGAMDSFSSNGDKSYAMTSTQGDHAPQYPLGNFDVKVNGDSLDKSQWIDITFDKLLADGDDSSAMGSGFSPLCLCPIGECVIQPGLNEITYERLGSYNLIISDLIFIGSEYEHVHAAASTWSSDADSHWHVCTAVGCPTGKLDAASHTFGDKYDEVVATCSAKGSYKQKCTVCDYVKTVETDMIAHTYPNNGEYAQTKAPTCDEAGSKERECSVCHAKDVKVVPALGHTLGDAVENYAAVTEGENQHIAATAHNCSVCDKSALRWSALDFDETLSSGTSKVKVNGSDTENAVKTGAAENDGGQNNASPAVSVGNHYVYKVNVSAAVEKAGLSFRVLTRTSAYPVFRTQSSDGKRGNYYDEATQEFTAAPARYGVRVNGQEVYFNEDLLAAEGNAETNKVLWFDFPLNSFSLNAGVNIIDVYSMGGYSQQGILEFQLTGLAHVSSSHVHNGDATWLSDENNHWHVCSAEGCPIADGIYDKEEHDWDEVVVTTQPTCTATGAGTKECKVCHKIVDVVVPAKGHTFGEAQTAVGDAIPHECSVCHAMAYDLALATPQKVKADVEWSVAGMPAGTYEVYAYACAASSTLSQNMQSRYQFGFDGNYVGLSARTPYSNFDFGTGEDAESCQWTKPILQVTAGESAAKFAIHWVGSGYSAFYAAIRLVKIA